MPFGFFDWLRVRTRDAILNGATEAGQSLEQGTKALAERTEAVAAFDSQTKAELPRTCAQGPGSITASETRQTAALPAAPAQKQRDQGAKVAPSSTEQKPQPRSISPKTQKLLDARPESDL